VKEHGSEAGIGQGSRSDIADFKATMWQIKERIRDGATEDELWNEFFPYMVRNYCGVREYLYRQRGKYKAADFSEGSPPDFPGSDVFGGTPHQRKEARWYEQEGH
jgi:hypothetical protein